MTVVEVGWKHVAEGLRRRVEEMNSKLDELTGYINRVGELTQSNEALQQQVNKAEEEHQAVVAQWGVLEQVTCNVSSFFCDKHEMMYILIATKRSQ